MKHANDGVPRYPTFVIPVGWSPNIGNAFFALGIQHLLQTTVSNSRVVLLSDQAAYLNFLPGRSYRREPKNSVRYLDAVRPEYIVLCGSILTRHLPSIWTKSLECLLNNGTRLLLIGVGYYDYTQEESETCKGFLKRFPPYVLATRDQHTYDDLKDYAEHSYSGIDGAYWLPDVFQPIRTELPPYIVLNFDKAPQPDIRTCNTGSCDGRSREEIVRFAFRGLDWELCFSPYLLAITRKFGAGARYPLSLLGLGNSAQKSVEEYMVIHTDHSLNPLVTPKTFGSANAFAGDLPYTYLNLYSQSELTITDRIHAALVTLAYGRPAYLVTSSGRASIIERIAGQDPTRGPISLDIPRLELEKSLQADFLHAIDFS